MKRQGLKSTKEFPRVLQMIMKIGLVKVARTLIEMNPQASRAAKTTKAADSAHLPKAGEGPAPMARKEATMRAS